MPGNGDVTAGSCTINFKVDGQPHAHQVNDSGCGEPLKLTMWTEGPVEGGFQAQTLTIHKDGKLKFRWR